MRRRKDVYLFFAKGILWGLIFIGGNFFAKSIFIDQVLQYTNLYRSDYEFNQAKERIRILVAGDSHPRADVYPELLENSFIVAYGGENTILTFYRLYNYIEIQNLDIELVLLPFDLHTFSEYRKNTYGENGIAGAAWWSDYIDYGDLCTGKVDGLNLFCWVKRLEAEFPYKDGIEKTRNYAYIKLGKSNFSQLDFGSLPGKGDFSIEPDPVNKALTRARGHLSNYDATDIDLITYYIRTIKMLKDNGVNVVLVRYPITNPYYRMANRIIDADEFYTKLGELLKEDNVDVPVLDYHDLYWKQNEKFSDPDHLNLDGAKEFTLQLKNDLENLGYIK